MPNPGWIAVWRKIRDHWTWKKKPFSPGQAWIDLLLRCNFSEKAIPNPGRVGPAYLSPGEAIISLRLLEAAWGWHRKRVIRFLKALKNDTMISTTNEVTFTRVKVLKWQELQPKATVEEMETTPQTTPQWSFENVRLVFTIAGRLRKNGGPSLTRTGDLTIMSRCRADCFTI